jgi:hypothetical protein
MKRLSALHLLPLAVLALTQPGCAVHCGPIHTVPRQKVHLITPSPSSCSTRVFTSDDTHTDTAVPADGRVSFEVPIGSRYCTPYLFNVVKVGWPTPVEKRRVIRVMRGEQVIRKLSASDISALPQDTDGYHALRIGE